MNTKSIALVLSAGLLASIPAYSQNKSPSVRNTSDAAKAKAALRVNPSFTAARKSFDKSDPAESARQIKAGAGKMRAAVVSSTLPAAKGVKTSAAGLELLAGQVESGKVKDGNKLNQAFANAHHSLAAFQHAKAESFHAEKKNLQAGQAMNRTADHVELAASWSGQKLDDKQNAVVKGLRNVAGGLIGGAGTVVQGTGSILKGGLGLITGLGNAIKGEKKAPAGNLGKDAVDGTRKVTGGAVKGAGKVGEAGAGLVEKTGEGIKKVGEKVAGKEKATKAEKKDK